MAARRWRSGFRLPPPCGSPDCRPLRMTPDRKPGGPSAPHPLRSHPSTDAAILAPGVAEPGGPPARTRAGHVPVQRAGSPRLARSRRVLQGSGARARSPGTRRPPSPPARRTRTVPGGSAARAAGRHPARSGRRLRQAPCTVVPSPAWRRGPALLAGTPAKPRLRTTPAHAVRGPAPVRRNPLRVAPRLAARAGAAGGRSRQLTSGHGRRVRPGRPDPGQVRPQRRPRRACAAPAAARLRRAGPAPRVVIAGPSGHPSPLQARTCSSSAPKHRFSGSISTALAPSSTLPATQAGTPCPSATSTARAASAGARYSAKPAPMLRLP